MMMVRELKRELELERKANAQREKNCKAVAKKYTLEFFREKSAEIHEVVQNENIYLYKCFDDLRDKYFKREKKNGAIAKLFMKQERMICDQRLFIKSNIKQIFDKLDGRVVDRLAEILPTSESFSKYDMENPFSLYCGYLDLVRPIDIENEYVDMTQKVTELQELLAQQAQEFETSQQVSNMYIDQENTYKNKIANLNN